MSTRAEPKSHDPVVSTRYPADLIRWLRRETGMTNAELLRRALDDLVMVIRRDAA